MWNIRFRQHYRNQFNCETLVSLDSHGIGTMRRYELRSLPFDLLLRSISHGVRGLAGNTTGHCAFSAPPRPGSAQRPAERAARSWSCGPDIVAARRPYVLWHRRDGARPVEREFSAPPRQSSAHRRLERAARSGRCGPDIDASRRPYVLWHRRDGARPFERRRVHAPLRSRSDSNAARRSTPEAGQAESTRFCAREHRRGVLGAHVTRGTAISGLRESGTRIPLRPGHDA